LWRIQGDPRTREPHDIDEVDRPLFAHLVGDVDAVDGLRVLGLGCPRSNPSPEGTAPQPDAAEQRRDVATTEVVVNGLDVSLHP